MPSITDMRKENCPDYITDWTYGTGGAHGRFGGAHSDGRLILHSWEYGLVTRTIKCSTYRKAVRRLRRHLAGY